MKKSFLYLLLLTAFNAFAQQDFTMYHMRNIPQGSYTNPAFIPNSKVNIGLPVISSNYLSLSNSGFRWADVVQRRPDDSLTLNMGNLLEKLGDKNYLVLHANIDLFSIGLDIKNNYFTLNVTERVNSTFTYPKGLIQLFWEGNGGDLLGQRASFDGLGYDFTHYREYALGYARPINDKLTIGGRAKFLTGFQNIWTKKSQMGLTTSESNFDLVFDGSLDMRTSGVAMIGDADYNIADHIFKTSNRGLALDLGANYQFSEDITFSASVLDLGYIRWKDNVKNFQQDDFEFVFSGISLDEIMGSEDTTAGGAFTALMDSINNTIVLKETDDAYTKWLSSRIVLGGTYRLNENNFVGAIWQTEFFKGRARNAISLSYNTRVKRWLNFTLSYSAYNRSFLNLGTGLSLNAGPLQIYAVTDNFLAPIIPHKVKNAHLRFGFNLTFGRKKLAPTIDSTVNQ